MTNRGAILGVAALLLTSGCKQIDSSDSNARAEPEVAEPEVAEPSTVEPNAAEPEPAEPELAAPEPAAPTTPEPNTPVLAIRVSPDPDAPLDLEFDATPKPEGTPLAGLTVHPCHQARDKAVPCGWAKLCRELGTRWLDQLGVPEAIEEVEDLEYPERKCGAAEPPPTSGDFVAHAVVIEHSLDVLALDLVKGLLVRTSAGWKGLARIDEQVMHGMSVRQVYEPVGTWQLELDEHPGKELVVLVTGYEIYGNDGFRTARVIVCRAQPKPECRRIRLDEASEVEFFADGSVAVDSKAAKGFAELGRADTPLIGGK